MSEKSTTKRSHRIFALTMAVLFLVTSAAFSIVVIVQMVDQNKKNKAAESANTALTSQQDTSDNNQTETKMKDFTPISKVSELQKIDTKPGDGQAVKSGDTVTVTYTGALASNGIIFDSTNKHGGQPATFPLSGVIKGWQEGIPGMKVGGTRRLLIPAELGYGSQAQSGIPANSDLVFDVTLLKIGAN